MIGGVEVKLRSRIEGDCRDSKNLLLEHSDRSKNCERVLLIVANAVGAPGLSR